MTLCVCLSVGRSGFGASFEKVMIVISVVCCLICSSILIMSESLLSLKVFVSNMTSCCL